MVPRSVSLSPIKSCRSYGAWLNWGAVVAINMALLTELDASSVAHGLVVGAAAAVDRSNRQVKSVNSGVPFFSLLSLVVGLSRRTSCRRIGRGSRQSTAVKPGSE